MDNAMPIVIGGGIILFVIVICYLAWLYEKKRRDAFAALALRLNMQFYPQKDYHFPGRFTFLNALDEGANRYAYNRLEGDYRGHPVTVFDYHYETYSTDDKGSRQTHHHQFSFFILFLERPFPELRIYPENFLSKIGQALGYDDIDFESLEFSRAFTVRSKDKKFAYDVCHARMMEHLLSDRSLAVEIEGNCLALSAATRLAAEKIPAQLDRLIAVRGLFPEYLFDNAVGSNA